LSNLASVTAKREFAEACKANWPCAEECVQNYDAAACPIGWISREDGLCDAPLKYDGPCEAQEYVPGESEFKHQFGLDCKSRWPCKRDCTEHFGLPCPRDWYLVDGVCTRLRNEGKAAYNGPCLPFADLQNFSMDEKRSFAAKCDVDFCEAELPSATCDLDLASPCPVGWLHVGSRKGYCLGHGYQGPCRPALSSAELDVIGRAVFAERCGVTWPCAKPKQPPKLLRGELVPSMSGPVTADGRVVVATA